MTAAPDVSSQPVLLEKLEAGVMTLTLNRPERLNAFNTALHEALFAGVERAAADPDCRAVLLTGAGKGFCAGQDLTDRVVAPDGRAPISARRSSGAITRLCARFAGFPSPSSALSTAPRLGRGPISRSPATLCSAPDQQNSCRPSRALAPYSRLGGHLFPAASRRRRPRPRARHAGRPDQRGTGGSLGDDLPRRRRF